MDLRRHYCSVCLTPKRPGHLFCHCGSSSFSPADRPLVAERLYRAQRYDLPWPWLVLEDWQPGMLVLLAGGPGSGKSSLAALLRPSLWLTSEQEPAEAAALLARCGGGEVPPVQPVRDVQELRQAIDRAEPGLWVVDSVTEIGTWDEQQHILRHIAERTRGSGSRSCIIQQINAKGEGAGMMALPHLVDASALIEKEDVRRLTFWKNRGGAIGSAIFGLGANGVTRPNLAIASYSVEGQAGRYRLHPWPLSGARWAGLFDAMWKNPARARPGLACAAMPVAGYPGGVLQPPDVEERKRFAELNGLIWVDNPQQLEEECQPSAP